MKRIYSLTFVLTLFLTSCLSLGAPKQTVTININVASAIGVNPDAYVESVTNGSYTTKWVSKNEDAPKDPWGWITTDTEKVKTLIAVTAMNDRISSRFNGLDPFQFGIVEGPDIDKISEFASTGIASTDRKFTGAEWNMTLEASEDPYPLNGLELMGFTNMGVLMKETLPGSYASILLPFEDFKALMLGTKIKIESPVTVETDMVTCLNAGYDKSEWIATLEVRPWESDFALIYYETLKDALFSSISGPVTVYHAEITETHQECSSLIAMKYISPTSTPFPSSTPYLSATPVPSIMP